MAESKIKSHTRRIRGKQVRVKEGRRKLGLKIAAIGVTGAGLIVSGRKLTKMVNQSPRNPKNMAIGRSAKPDGVLINQVIGTLNGKPAITSLEMRPNRKAYQTAISIDTLNAAKSKATPTYVVPDSVKATVEETVSNVKKGMSAYKINNRRKLLEQVEATYDPNDVWPIKPIYEASARNKNRSGRKKAAKRLSDAANDLRARGLYE